MLHDVQCNISHQLLGDACIGVGQMLAYYSSNDNGDSDGSGEVSTSYDGTLNTLPESMRLTREDIRR